MEVLITTNPSTQLVTLGFDAGSTNVLTFTPPAEVTNGVTIDLNHFAQSSVGAPITFSLVGGDTNKVTLVDNSGLLTMKYGKGSPNYVIVRATSADSPDYPSVFKEETIGFKPAQAQITFTNLVQTQGETFKRVYNLPESQASLYGGQMVVTYNGSLDEPTQPGTYTVWVSVIESNPDFFGDKIETLTILPSFAGSFPNLGPNDDPDGDGIPALMEYALGGSVGISDLDKLPQTEFSNNTLRLIAVVRTNDPNLIIEPVRSTTLGQEASTWTTNQTISTNHPNTSGVAPGFQRRIYSTTGTNEIMAFLRLQVRTNSLSP